MAIVDHQLCCLYIKYLVFGCRFSFDHLTLVISVDRASRCRIEPSARSPSQLVPTELWQKIFTIACLDDGSTGRSLSLVSRYVRETSKPFKFQSLAIRNLRQAEALPHALKQRAPNQQPVNHLFVLCDLEKMHPCGNTEQEKVASSSSLRRFTSMLSRLSPKHKPPRTEQSPFEIILSELHKVQKPVSPVMLETLMAVAVCCILVAISPTLRTLSISISSAESFFSLYGSSALPVLEELTIAYGNGSSMFPPARLLASLQPLPSLRRLNLHRFYEWLDAPELLGHISRFAPNVKLVILPWIRTGWGNYSVLWAHDPWLSLPMCAATIYIQFPTPSPPLSPQLHDRTTLSDCRRLAENDGRIIFKRADREPWVFNGRKLEMEWEARINGSDECWRTDDGVDLSSSHLDEDMCILSS